MIAHMATLAASPHAEGTMSSLSAPTQRPERGAGPRRFFVKGWPAYLNARGHPRHGGDVPAG